MIDREDLLILAVFGLTLADLVLCLIAFSDLARSQVKRLLFLVLWYLICALVPLVGPITYLLLRKRFGLQL